MSSSQRFFMLPLGWHRDPIVGRLSALGVNVFLALVEYCQVTGNRGVMTWDEVASIARSFVRGRSVIGQLVSEGAVISESGEGEESDIVRLANPQRWLFIGSPRKSMSAGQDAGVASSSVAESRARVKKERETDREDERTPSGSVRSSSARAAPRSAGGAARPALAVVDGRGSVVTFPKLPEAVALQAEMAIQGNVRARKMLDEKYPGWESGMVIESLADRIDAAAAE